MIPTVYLELYSSSVCCGGVLIHLGYLCKNKNFFRPSQFIPFQGNLKAIKLTMAPGTQRTPMAPVTPMTPMTVLENTKRIKKQKKEEHRRKRKIQSVLKVRETKTMRPNEYWVWLF